MRLNELEGFQDASDDPEHVPAYLSQAIYGQLETWRRAGQIGEIELLFLDRHAAALMDICGGCERIRKTPISFSYRRFLRQVIALYLLTLPWGLARDLGIWTVPSVAMIGYFMIGIELLAEDIEDPFGLHVDDLRLDELCGGIERSIREIAQARLRTLAGRGHAFSALEAVASPGSAPKSSSKRIASRSAARSRSLNSSSTASHLVSNVLLCKASESQAEKISLLVMYEKLAPARNPRLVQTGAPAKKQNNIVFIQTLPAMRDTRRSTGVHGERSGPPAMSTSEKERG